MASRCWHPGRIPLSFPFRSLRSLKVYLRVRTCLLLAWLLLLPETFVRAQEKKEPSFEGKSLSEWVKLLKSPKAEVRGEAARALGQIGPKAKSAVPALIDALKDKNEGVRNDAAVALGAIGPEARA